MAAGPNGLVQNSNNASQSLQPNLPIPANMPPGVENPDLGSADGQTGEASRAQQGVHEPLRHTLNAYPDEQEAQYVARIMRQYNVTAEQALELYKEQGWEMYLEDT